MGQPVVHFEVIGKDPEKLRRYYGDLFGWAFDTSGKVAEEVSEPTNYGFVERNTTPDGVGIPGGVGGGKGYDAHAIFYVGVPNVKEALEKAETLGGKRRMGPARASGRDLVVGFFTDPEGNLIGVAGPA
jgi:predicted enzyme related to lactoylglutathione lyase